MMFVSLEYSTERRIRITQKKKNNKKKGKEYSVPSRELFEGKLQTTKI